MGYQQRCRYDEARFQAHGLGGFFKRYSGKIPSGTCSHLSVVYRTVPQAAKAVPARGTLRRNTKNNRKTTRKRAFTNPPRLQCDRNATVNPMVGRGAAEWSYDVDTRLSNANLRIYHHSGLVNLNSNFKLEVEATSNIESCEFPDVVLHVATADNLKLEQDSCLKPARGP